MICFILLSWYYRTTLLKKSHKPMNIMQMNNASTELNANNSPRNDCKNQDIIYKEYFKVIMKIIKTKEFQCC